MLRNRRRRTRDVGLRRHSALFVSWSACSLLAACERPAPSRSATQSPQLTTVGWPAYAGDAGSLRYSSLADVDTLNVRTLTPAWTWKANELDTIAERTGERVHAGRFQATPLAFGDTLFFSTAFNRVVAIDARSGEEWWRFDPDAVRDGPIGDDRAGFVHRGVATWTDDHQRRIFLASRGRLFAIDAQTGQRITTFGDSGAVDLTTDLRWPVDRNHFGNSSPPVVFRDLVIVGSSVADRLVYPRDPPGSILAFNARSGQRVWRWDAVPSATDPARSTWENGAADSVGHANVWAAFSVDVRSGLVFLPVSGASNDFYGGKRLGDNKHAESLVCLNANTGQLVWAQQLVHHGLWDYDLASPPALTSTRRNGVAVEEVWIAGKTGYVYAFDRHTGKPVWPMTERAVPASDVAGERAALTQPHPAWPMPIARQGFTMTDVVDFTPEIQAQAQRVIRDKRLGPLFTPPSIEGTVQMPGWIGGAGWGSTAVDPVRQLAFFKATNLPILAQIKSTGDARGFIAADVLDPTRSLSIELPDTRWWSRGRSNPVRIPISKPPYGTLTAIDLATGVHRWSVPLGDSPAIRNHPKLRSLNLPQLGVAGAPGGLATASGLVFITGGGDVLYAIDSNNGSTRWSAKLGQIGYSNPMTYRATDGRQYVVIATGEGASATLQAFALPVHQ